MKRFLNRLLVINPIRTFLLVIIMAMNAVCVLAAASVTIKGQVFSADKDNSRVKITVIQGSETMELKLSESGHFNLKLEASDNALLRFEKLGCITKEVLLDMTNIYATNRAKRKNKVIRFDVELMPENFGAPVAFIAPVGQIRFLNGSGLMRIERMYVLRKIHDPDNPDGEETATRQ